MGQASDPPQYESHFVVSRSANPSLTSEDAIRLRLDRPDAVWTTGEVASGTLTLSSIISNRITCIEILLLLTDSFMVSNRTSTRLTTKSLKLSSLEIPSSVIPADLSSGIETLEWEYKFSIEISTDARTSKFRDQNALPPSMDGITGREHSSFCASIAYSFVALAHLSTGKILKSTPQPIRVCPKFDLCPLYDCSHSATQQLIKAGRFRKRHVNDVKLRIKHVPYLYTSPTNINCLEFDIYLSLPGSESRRAGGVPPQIQGIKYSLVAITRSLKEYDLDKSEQSTTHSIRQTVASANMAVARSAAVWNKPDKSQFHVALKMPIILGDIISSFVSILVERKHALKIIVMFAQDMSSEFEIPITVVHR